MWYISLVVLRHMLGLTVFSLDESRQMAGCTLVWCLPVSHPILSPCSLFGPVLLPARGLTIPTPGDALLAPHGHAPCSREHFPVLATHVSLVTLVNTPPVYINAPGGGGLTMCLLPARGFTIPALGGMLLAPHGHFPGAFSRARDP